MKLDYTDEMNDLLRVAGGVSAILLSLGLTDDGELPEVPQMGDGLYVLGSALQSAADAFVLAKVANGIASARVEQASD